MDNIVRIKHKRSLLALILLLAMLISLVSCVKTPDDPTPDIGSSDNATSPIDPETTVSQPSDSPRLIYYVDFEDVPTTLSESELLSEYGWVKDTVANFAYSENTTKYSIKVKDGNRMLYLENNISSGKDSYLLLLSSAQMGAYNEKNYTYQYDVIYTDASAADRYIALVSSYNGKFYNSFHFRNRGTANNQCHVDASWGTYDVKGECYAASTDDNAIVTKLLGKKYNASSQAFSGISVSIRYVVDWENGNSVYMRVNDEGYPGSGVWTLVSKYANTDSKNYFSSDVGGAAIVLKTGGKQNGYVDNIMVWEGTGEEPEDKSSPIFKKYSEECTSHSWTGKGNCESPAVCRYCGIERGDDTSHKYASVSGTSDRRCTVCGRYESTGSTTQLLTSVPFYDGGTKAARLYESGHGLDSEFSVENDTYMQLISLTSEAEFKNYLTKLEKYGYKQTYSYSRDNNLYAQYLLGEQRIYLYYTASTKEVRIIEDDKSGYSPEEFGYSYEKKSGETTVLYQYGLPMNEAGVNISKNDEMKIDCGMMYVIKLADNSVFIMDGGGYQQFDTAQIDGFMKFLREITGTKSGKVRIAGWYVSHGHSDHMGGMALFIARYSNSLTLERVFFNIPSCNSPTEILVSGSSNHRKLVNYIDSYFGRDNVKYIKIHTGERTQLADVMINVIYTHEDIVSSVSGLSGVANDYNNSSSVLSIELDGKKFLLLGDVNRPAMEVIMKINSNATLKSDILQLAHHVINNLEELYHVVQAPVVFAPQSPNGAINGSARKKALAAAKTYLESENMLFYASEGTVGIAVEDTKIRAVFTAPVDGRKYTGWTW